MIVAEYIIAHRHAQVLLGGDSLDETKSQVQSEL